MENLTLFEPFGSDISVLKELKSGERSCKLLYDGVCRRKMILKSGSPERIENEAVMLAKFSGEGVPALYGCFTRDGVSFLLREYVEGESLRDKIRRDGCFSASETAKIGIKICNVLERMHSSEPPAIHRDVKTENVIITPSGGIYIIDFDITREYDGCSERDTSVLGTPLTAPPEQFGYSQTDERSDVYAVGVLLGELAYGTVKPDPKELKGRLGRIIKRCTGFAPESRYRNAGELKKALEKAAYPRGRKRFAAVSASAAAVALSFLAGGFAFSHLPARQPEEDAVPYVFADPGIEAAVRDMLEMPQGDIFPEDLEKITEISIVGDCNASSWEEIITHGNEITVGGEMIATYGNISSLEDVRSMPNLKTLIVANQRISDLSPLEGSCVMELMIHGNEVSDLSPLSECRSLTKLSLSANPISDIGPITSLPALSELDIGATDLTSLDGCEKIRCLTNLVINDCARLEDYSVLPELTTLTFLSLRPTPDDVFDAVTQLKNLRCLFIWSAPKFTSLSQLSNLTELTYLGSDGCRLSSLEGAAAFQNLVSLAFRYNYVEDLSPLRELPRLKYLAISGNPVGDLSPVESLSELLSLSVDSSQLSRLGDIPDDVEIVVD